MSEISATSISPPRLAVLISGGGTTLVNLQRRIDEGALPAKIALVIASRACQGVERAREAGLPVEIIERSQFASATAYSQEIFSLCRNARAGLAVLGGFLNRIEVPEDFLHRVINIHPALIPAFCGQGMYGHHVHEAVLARGCKVSGCTVHFCDNEYDHGPIILQRTVPVLDDDDADRLAARVFEAECEAYPEAIALFSQGRLRVEGRRVRITPA
jgi:formyltetrahydrofolate-dependent phosphoribosylglycinamide formyltransferase